MSLPMVPITLNLPPEGHAMLVAAAALEGNQSPEAYILKTMANYIAEAFIDGDRMDLQSVFLTGTVIEGKEEA
jgi:hypothetical protein